MSDEENRDLSSANGEKNEMEVDHKEESTPDKGGGGDHQSDTSNSDNEDKDVKDNEDDKKPEKKEEKRTETPKKADKPTNKTPKKSKKAESDDDGDSDAGGDDDDKVALLERPVVISGKRERKKVERIDVSSGATPKEKKLEVPEGKGTALGEIPNIEFKFGKTLADDLKPLHRFVYGRAGTATEIKKNLRKFCGFDFKKDSPEYTKKTGILNKMTMAQMKGMCEVLDLERGGTKETIVTRLMDFFLKPTSSGKKLLADKKRKRSSSGKGKKTKTKKRGKKEGKKEKKTKKKVSSKDSEIEDSDSDEDESDAEDDGSDEDEKPKKKAKAPAKKKAQKKNESDDEDDGDESEKDDDDESESEDEQPKKKKAKVEPKKETKKPEKKATPKKKKNESDDESSGSESDDEPLVKPKSPKPPSDDELKEVIKKILDGANLEEVTMKTVCKQVYAKYEQFDLTDRKDFIKSTVKEIIR